MQFRPLGSTGIDVSALAFGAGPVSGLMTVDADDRQQAVIRRAVELGINWFDTAATYGNGQSERSLGNALNRLRSESPLHVATKVRVDVANETVTNKTDLRPVVLNSVRQSLARLKLERVTLLQIHNSITWNRHDQPTSIIPDDVMGSRGLLAGMQDAREAGLVNHFGLTGMGDADALRAVMQSRQFATIQAPFHILNPSALRETPTSLCDPDYGGFLRTAHDLGMGIFAIRVYAAGALLGSEPSAHTLKTQFFPLDLYRRDQSRVQKLTPKLRVPSELRKDALRYVLSQPEISSAIIGFGETSHVEHAARIADLAPMLVSDRLALEILRNSAIA